MKSIELRVPPPLVAIAFAAAMWGISLATPVLRLPGMARVVVALAIALIGASFSVAGVAAFRRAKTTVDPTKPETASSLVTAGVYRLTRNPMYVGLLFVLVGWAVFLSSGWALLGPVCFHFYLNRFQIAPEERALAARFGSEYLAYQAEVPRWL